MNKSLGENIHNIERNTTLSFGVCQCSWSGEKTFKDMNWVIKDTNLNLQTQIDKVQYNKHLNMHFRSLYF